MRTPHRAGGRDLSPPPALSEAEFEKRYPALLRFASVVGDMDMDPADLVQDALVGLLRQPPGHVQDVDVYLRRSIVNAVARERRRAAQESRQAAGVVGARGHHVEYPSDLKALLSLVKPADRALLYLLDVEGVPTREAGEILGLSSVAVRARASRARRSALRLLRGVLG